MVNQRDENGKKHGVWVEYYSNSQLWSKGVYKNGVWHGLFEFYKFDGTLWDKGEWKNGKDRGLWYEKKHSK